MFTAALIKQPETGNKLDIPQWKMDKIKNVMHLINGILIRCKNDIMKLVDKEYNQKKFNNNEITHTQKKIKT